MLNIFLTSRMNNEVFWERKILVERLNSENYTPLYFEGEPKDIPKEVMDYMLQNSDVFMPLYFITCGREAPDLGNVTPIEYELLEYIQQQDRFPREMKKPILLLDKELPAEISQDQSFEKLSQIQKLHNLKEKIERYQEEIGQEPNTRKVSFMNINEVLPKICEILAKFREKSEKSMAWEKQQEKKYVIKYHGPDTVGLIATITDVLFNRFLMNIENVSHATGGKTATVFIWCKPRSHMEDYFLQELNEMFSSKVRNMLKKRLSILEKKKEKNCSEDRTILVKNIQNTIENLRQFYEQERYFSIEQEFTCQAEEEQECYYMEVRHIDAPGQLSIICSKLKEENINIEDLYLLPVEGYKRQRNLRVWFRDLEHREEERLIPALESKLYNIIGVRAVSIIPKSF